MADLSEVAVDSEIWMKVPIVTVDKGDTKFCGVQVLIAGYPMWLTKEEFEAARVEAPE